MASAATISLSEAEPEAPKVQASDISSIKAFAEPTGASHIPSTYHSFTDLHDDVADELAASVPVIDLSLLTSHDPQIHTKALYQLGKACAEWGFFMLTNHEIPEKLMEDVKKKSREFHDLPVEEKEFSDKGPFTPIRYGTSFYPEAENVHYWRDYPKVITFPEFNFPHKPPGKLPVIIAKKSEVWQGRFLKEYQSLGLESNSIIESSGFDSGLQLFIANLYTPCSQPQLALGMLPHSDLCFLTLLTQNGIGGLQVKHDGKWVNVNPLPNSLMVILGDQLEVVSNGRYESVLHRTILNNRKTRMSLVVANGPALDNEIGPAPELLEKEKPLFRRFKYEDQFKIQQRTRFADKSALEEIRLSAQQE